MYNCTNVCMLYCIAIKICTDDNNINKNGKGNCSLDDELRLTESTALRDYIPN